MRSCAALTVIAIAFTALVACGSTTSTRAEMPQAAAPETRAKAQPALADPAPPLLTLAELADAMQPAGAAQVIAGLGELGLPVQCPTEGWKSEPAKLVESASCPAGLVRLGEVSGSLAVIVTRQIEEPSAASAMLVVTAIGEPVQWESRVRAMLLQARNAVDQVAAVANEALPYFVPLGGEVQAHISDDSSEPLRLVIGRRSRGLRR